MMIKIKSNIIIFNYTDLDNLLVFEVLLFLRELRDSFPVIQQIFFESKILCT